MKIKTTQNNTELIFINEALTMLIKSQENQVLTMTSRQIAEVTGKQHGHVKRDIENMLKELSEDVSKFGRIYLDSMNRAQTEYALDRDFVDCLLTGYSAVLRMKVIKRWKELEEKKQQPQLPQTYLEALKELVVKTEENEQLKTETLRLNSVCNEMANQFAAGTTIPAFCKQLNGVNIMQINSWLVSKGYLRPVYHGYEPTSYTRDKYFKFTNKTETNKKQNREYTKAEVTLTLQGAKWIYSLYLKEQLPMKKTWNNKLSHITL